MIEPTAPSSVQHLSAVIGPIIQLEPHIFLLYQNSQMNLLQPFSHGFLKGSY